MQFQYREVTPVDLDFICSHREAIFREAGSAEIVLTQMRPVHRDWLNTRLNSGDYSGYLCESAGNVIAGIGFIAFDWPPIGRQPTTTQRANILNLYVEHAFRRTGIATKLLAMVEEKIGQSGITVAFLHAEPTARKLYEKMGWRGTFEMDKSINSG